jgi:hypothetical protein
VFPNDVAGACHHSVNRFDTSRAYHRAWWCSEHPDRQRDRLAAMAMQGAMANLEVLSRLEDEPTERFARNVAGHAYEIADAMLAERVRE